jgi:hypothetical protein
VDEVVKPSLEAGAPRQERCSAALTARVIAGAVALGNGQTDRQIMQLSRRMPWLVVVHRWPP